MAITGFGFHEPEMVGIGKKACPADQSTRGVMGGEGG